MNMNSQNALNAYSNEAFQAMGETALCTIDHKEKQPLPPDYYETVHFEKQMEEAGPLPVKQPLHM